MTGGYLACTFDLLNVRDLDLIAQAKTLCDRLIVGVFDDDYAEHVRGRPPIVPLSERLALVSHVREVDEAVVHSEDCLGQLADEHIVFTVDDEVYTFDDARRAVTLTSTRQTASWMLQNALRAALGESVA